MTKGRTLRSIVGMAVLCSGVLLAPGQVMADENTVLDYCLQRPQNCALSVHAIDEGWERHQNADRPQVLASTFKILVLIAYAEAVAAGQVSPDDLIDKEDWGRYFSGGTTLATSWGDLGNADRVRLDDLARVMILNSDNSAPDFFLAHLPKKRIKKAAKRFGWHDLPAGISSMFGLWQNLNGVGGTGNRIAAEYGAFGVKSYQKELAKHAKSLKNDAFVEKVREALCEQPPWVSGPAPCDRPQPGTTEKSFRILENRHFNRSTTRSYAALMRKLLERTALSPAAQAVVERHLDEAWLERFPDLSPTFTRFGLKGGNLGTGAGPEILTWAHYMEAGDGSRYVVVVFLQDLARTKKRPGAADVNLFAQRIALNADFRQKVRDAFDEEALSPELVPELKSVKLQGGKNLTVRAQVLNTSPVSSGAPITVSLFLVDEADTGGAVALDTVQVPAIAGFRKKAVRLKATSDDAAGRFAVVHVDSGEAVSEQDEENNVTWERLD